MFETLKRLVTGVDDDKPDPRFDELRRQLRKEIPPFSEGLVRLMREQHTFEVCAANWDYARGVLSSDEHEQKLNELSAKRQRENPERTAMEFAFLRGRISGDELVAYYDSLPKKPWGPEESA